MLQDTLPQKGDLALFKLPSEQINTLLKNFHEGVIALDLETTGLSPFFNKIIEIGAFKVTAQGSLKTFNELINPHVPISPENTKIHNIKNQDISDCEPIETILPKFLTFAKDLPIIAHNAPFDLGFILFQIHQLSLSFPQNPVYCSIKWSRKVFPNQSSYALKSLCKSFDIKLENHHRALWDAWGCLNIFSHGLSKSPQTSLEKGLLFYCSDFKKESFYEIPPHLHQLEEFIQKEEIIDIKYKGGSHKNIFRPIRPVGLFPLPQNNVLYAHCLISDIYKNFILKKITAIRKHEKDLKTTS